MIIHKSSEVCPVTVNDRIQLSQTLKSKQWHCDSQLCWTNLLQTLLYNRKHTQQVVYRLARLIFTFVHNYNTVLLTESTTSTNTGLYMLFCSQNNQTRVGFWIICKSYMFMFCVLMIYTIPPLYWIHLGAWFLEQGLQDKSCQVYLQHIYTLVEEVLTSLTLGKAKGSKCPVLPENIVCTFVDSVFFFIHLIRKTV